MNFQVPQFIEVEDKIFGPLSFRQFLYIAGGAGLGYIFYTFESIPFFIRAIPVMAAVALGFAMAFYKVNDRPLDRTVEAGFKYYAKNRLYLWKKKEIPAAKSPAVAGAAPSASPLYVPKLSGRKLDDLSWSLDINEKVK